jgi:hypothetical protein
LAEFKRGELVKIIDYYFDVPNEDYGIYLSSSQGQVEYWGNKIQSRIFLVFCVRTQQVYRIPEQDLFCLLRPIEDDSAFHEIEAWRSGSR